MTTFVGIVGAKGGCGKTVTAINLTLAVSQFGRTTLLVDCHLSKPNVGFYLGMSALPRTLKTALAGHHHILQAVYPHPSGIHTITNTPLSKEHIRYDTLKSTLSGLLNQVEVVFVDTPSGVGHETETVIQICDKILLVTTPDFVSVQDTLESKKIAIAQRKDVLGVIVTQIKKTQYELSIETIQHTLNCPVIGTIQYDPKVCESQYFKHPIVYAHHSTPATIDYKKLAANLIGQEYVPDKTAKESFIDYLLVRIGLKKPKN